MARVVAESLTYPAFHAVAGQASRTGQDRYMNAIRIQLIALAVAAVGGALGGAGFVDRAGGVRRGAGRGGRHPRDAPLTRSGTRAQTRQYGSIACAYAIANQELNSIKEQAQGTVEVDCARSVDEAEEAISREHTLCRASRGVRVTP